MKKINLPPQSFSIKIYYFRDGNKLIIDRDGIKEEFENKLSRIIKEFEI